MLDPDFGDLPGDAGMARAICTDALWQARLLPRVLDLVEQRHGAPATRADEDAAVDRLLRHATARVPAYRGIPVAGGPRAALAGFPLTDSAQVRARWEDFCDDELDPDRCRLAVTSGTTGTPLTVVLDEDHFVANYADAMASDARLGIPLLARALRPGVTWLEGWFEYPTPALGLSRTADLGLGADPAGHREAALRAARFEPHVLLGLPSRCVEFARLLRRTGVRLGIPVVYTQGEQLTAADRTLLEEDLGARVVDVYGLKELGIVGTECSPGSYHVDQGRVVVEVVDDAGRAVPAGTEGSVVVTNLVNLAMPLIRYATGDRARLRAAPCGCGRPGATLSGLRGRSAVSVPLPDGSALGLLALSRHVIVAGVDRFQVVRVAPDRLQVNVVAGAAAGPGLARAIESRLAGVLRGRAEAAVSVVPAEDLVRGPAGKVSDYVDHTEAVAVG